MWCSPERRRQITGIIKLQIDHLPFSMDGTVVLAGKGIAALQEARIVDIAPPSDVPRLSMLGLFLTLQSVLAQLLMAVAVAVGFAWNRRGKARSSSGRAAAR